MRGNWISRCGPRMYGLLTRRSFTLGLTAIVDLVARRWKLGFTVAEAKAAAPPSPPIAPVVPETFDEFGGVRIDHYDWLRDRRDPRVVAYLDAENAYADADLSRSSRWSMSLPQN